MNRITISIFAAGIAIFGGGGFYLANITMMPENVEEMRDHNDDIMSYEISPGDVVKRIQSNNDVVLLDVRMPEEYEEVHLENALLLPVQELSAKTLAGIGLGEDAKDREIIIYCRSGARGKTAYDIMESLGYTNIKSIAGGMLHWQEDGYPLTESGAYTGPVPLSESESSDANESGPKVVLDRNLHDFGDIPQYGGTAMTTFTVVNAGSENLEVGDITTSCSCTSATISHTSIAPGKAATLTVTFDPNFHKEPLDVFKRTIFIPSNDPNNPEVEVAVQVDILEGK